MQGGVANDSPLTLTTGRIKITGIVAAYTGTSTTRTFLIQDNDGNNLLAMQLKANNTQVISFAVPLTFDNGCIITTVDTDAHLTIFRTREL
jgi:hypothetical protein